MQPTITDVAKHAGVAPSTVSYVLSGNQEHLSADASAGRDEHPSPEVPPARRRPFDACWSH